MKKSLKQLLNKKKWYYINENITEANFPRPKKIETQNPQIIKLEKTMTSQECLDLIKSKGCRPANIWELLEYVNTHELEKNKYLIAFGSQWVDSVCNHRVPYVDRFSDGDFRFILGSFAHDWGVVCCLLVFRDSKTSEPLALKDSTLDTRVDLKREVKKVIAICNNILENL
jgi:hypothetical protein